MYASQIVGGVDLRGDNRRRDAGGGARRRRIDLGSDQAHGQAPLRGDRLPAQLVSRQDERQVDGFLVEMVEDIAKEMGVEAVPVETTWATCVLDLQSNKTDLQFGLQATPKRALVIDFAGPAYNLYWYAVNHNGFKASAWEDYNEPEVKVAAMLGSADVVILQKVAPKATRVELNDVASIALAVTSGRADAMVTAVFGALVARTATRISATSCCRRRPSIFPPTSGCGAKTTTPCKNFCRPGPSGTICSVTPKPASRSISTALVPRTFRRTSGSEPLIRSKSRNVRSFFVIPATEGTQGPKIEAIVLCSTQGQALDPRFRGVTVTHCGFAGQGCAEGHAICITTGTWRWSSPIPIGGGTGSA